MMLRSAHLNLMQFRGRMCHCQLKRRRFHAWQQRTLVLNPTCCLSSRPLPFCQIRFRLGNSRLGSLKCSYVESLPCQMASEQRTPGMSFPKAKANWTPAIHKLFLELCLEQTLKGNKPGTHFTREGWGNIVESFCKRAGLRYDKKQLKNHWDVTKEQWKVWCKLTGTSSMKWDSDTHTFGASEEDWAVYLQANPDAAQFRYKEILFADKLETIFDGTANIGETEPPTQRRKHNDGSTSSLLYIKGPENAKPRKKFERHCDAVESRSTVTIQSVPGERNYSIGECIECLDEIEEVEQGSDLYLFALDVFLKKEYREIFLQLKKPSVRVAWLRWRQSVGPPLH